MIVILSRNCDEQSNMKPPYLTGHTSHHTNWVKKLIKSSDLSGDWGRVKHKLAVCRPCTNGGRIWTQIGGKNTVQIIAVHTSPHWTQIGRLDWRTIGRVKAQTPRICLSVVEQQKMHKLYCVQCIFTCTCVHMYVLYRFTTLDTNWVTWVETEGGWRGWRQTPAKDFLLAHDDDFTKNILFL